MLDDQYPSVEIWSLPTAINRDGVVVGLNLGVIGEQEGFPSDELQITPFIWTPEAGSLLALPLTGNDPRSTVPHAINELSAVVGNIRTLNEDLAVLWPTDGGVVDLNTRIDASLGWQLGRALAINELGYIAGIGINPNGQTEAFLLIPRSTQ